MCAAKSQTVKLTDADWIAIEREYCSRSLENFAKRAWHVIEPGEPLIWNWHMSVMCAYIQKFYEQKIKRLVLNVPPGAGKSVLFSVMGPSWAWSILPGSRILNITNAENLASRDSQRMRDIITSDWYRRLWPEVQLDKSQNEKMAFQNTAKGFRIGLGITSNLSGKRGNYLCLDDIIDTKKAFSDVENDSANNTYDQAVSSRLNDMSRDCIGIICQRTRENDIIGHIQSKKKQNWTIVKIAMEYEGDPGYDPVKDLGSEYAHLKDPRKTVGELMFPRRFPRDVVEGWKEDLGSYGTASQLQQRPQPLGGGIIKKHYWTPWPKDKPLPHCHLIFSSWDTAFTERDYKEAAYSAKTTWGVFDDEMTGRPAMIVLGRWFGRVAYPDLKKAVKTDFKEMNCDHTLIENKASGISLYQDMRRMRGISVRRFDPGQLDKIARAYRATPMMEAGLVYYPEGRQWAIDLIDTIAKFPTGAPPCKDLTDCTTQAIIWIRERGYMKPETDDYHQQQKEAQSEEAAEDNPKGRGSAYG